MARPRTIFTCQSCGHVAHRWMGKCPDCEAWNSFVEETERSDVKAPVMQIVPTFGRGTTGSKAQRITDVEVAEQPRLVTGLHQQDGDDRRAVDDHTPSGP